MIFYITSKVSFWINILAFISIIFFVIILFYHLRRELSKNQALVIVFLRFLVLTFVFLYLLGVTFVWGRWIWKKPFLRIYLDTSKSISLVTKHPEEKYKNIISLLDSFSNIHAQIFTFDNRIQQIPSEATISFNGMATSYEAIMEKEVKDPADWVFIVTDGNWNTGKDPAYFLNRIKIPIFWYPVDTNANFKDYALSVYGIPDQVKKGKKYKIKISVERNFIQQDTLTLLIRQNEKIIQRKPIIFDKHELNKEISYSVSFDREGKFLFNVSLKGEDTNTLNNQVSKEIQVLPDQYKILIFAGPPQPDIRILRLVLSEDSLFSIYWKTDLIKQNIDFSSLSDMDLIVFWDAPTAFSSKDVSKMLLESANLKHIPLWINVTQDNYAFIKKAFPSLRKVMGGKEEANVKIAIKDISNTALLLYSDLETNSQFWTSLPPIRSVLLEPKSFSPNFHTLLKGRKENRDGSILGYVQSQNRYIWWSSLQGLWKWHFYLIQNETYADGMKRWIRNLMLTMLRSKNFNPIHMDFDRNKLIKGAEIPFTVSIKNIEGKPYGNAYVKLYIKKKHDVVFFKEFLPGTFQKGKEQFFFTPNLPGEYRIQLKAYIDSIKIGDLNKSFMVKDIQAEEVFTGINMSELNRLAKLFNSKIIRSNKDLWNLLKSIDQLPPSKELIERKWSLPRNFNVFFIVIILISLEWILRKKWNLL